MNAFETILKQIEDSFTEEAQSIIDSEKKRFADYIERIILCGLSVEEFFKRECGISYVNNEYFRDIEKFSMLVIDRKTNKLAKSSKCDFYIDYVINNYIEMLKWKLKSSVYHYLAGVEMESF